MALAAACPYSRAAFASFFSTPSPRVYLQPRSLRSQ
jgi:hypothetical protein